jgi:tRNA(Ile)-lysidine synthase
MELPDETGAIIAEHVRVDNVPERLDLWCVVLPESAVEYPLSARTFVKGDRLRPIGLGRTKKLSDCFADRKVPREDRYRIPIVADARGILWVPGVVADERIRVCNVPCVGIRLRYDRSVRTPTV